MGWFRAPLKRGRSIDPKQPRLRAAGIPPAMRRGAFEVQAVAGLQAIVLAVAEPDFKCAAEDVEEFLAFVCVGFAAAPAALHTEKMRLHDGIAPGEEFHAHAGIGLQDFSLRWTHEARILSGGFEQGKDIGAIEARDAPQGGHGRTHLAALERAEEAAGDSGGASHLREGKPAARAQAAKALAGESSGFGGERDGALALEHVHNRSGGEAASAAEKKRALQQAHLSLRGQTTT